MKLGGVPLELVRFSVKAMLAPRFGRLLTRSLAVSAANDFHGAPEPASRAAKAPAITA